MKKPRIERWPLLGVVVAALVIVVGSVLVTSGQAQDRRRASSPLLDLVRQKGRALQAQRTKSARAAMLGVGNGGVLGASAAPAMVSDDQLVSLGISGMTGLVPPVNLPDLARRVDAEAKEVEKVLRERLGGDLARAMAPALGAGAGAPGASAPRFSWRIPVNIMTPAQQQGTWNTCWAFATVGAFESAYAKANQLQDANVVKFSEQAVIDCSGAGDAIRGGWWAFAYIRDKGATLETQDPYRLTNQTTNPTGTSGSCGDSTQYRASNLNYVTPSNAYFPTVSEIKQALVKHGPVVAGVFATDNFMSLTTGDVFTEQKGYDQNIGANHAVVIIGWNDAKQAWIVKNSYGNLWGIDGFGYVGYQTNNLGYGAAWVDAVSAAPAVRSQQLGAIRQVVPSAAAPEQDSAHTPPADAGKAPGDGAKVVPPPAMPPNEPVTDLDAPKGATPNPPAPRLNAPYRAPARK